MRGSAAVPGPIRLSFYPPIARSPVDAFVILRLSEKARSLSQSREEGRGGAKTEIENDGEAIQPVGPEGEKLNFIPRGIAELALEFLSITSPRYFCSYLRNYL